MSESKPILLIPVYRGGQFFVECLESLQGALDCFQQVVISFNGPDQEQDYAAFLRNRPGPEEKFLCLFTSATFDACRHLAFVAQKLRGIFDPEAPVFLLAHDDLLRADAVRRFLESGGLDGASFYLGDWIAFESTQPALEETQTALPADCASLGVEEWLQYNWSQERHHVYTNMTGIVVPLLSLRRVTDWYARTGSATGARFEYCLATSREHTRIQRSLEPLVKVRHHPAQEGRNLPHLASMADELRYRIWMMLNLRGRAFFSQVILGPWGLLPTLKLASRRLRCQVRKWLRSV
jgi:hypothetical protein